MIVRAPLLLPQRLINAFIESKIAWINDKKSLILKSPPVPTRQFVSGEKFWLFGELIPLRVVDDQKTALIFKEEFHLSSKSQGQASILFQNWYRAKARTVITQRVELLANRYGFKYGRIRISSARNRWGSCSSLGTLSFTWRLVMAPLEVIDYVVIHELVHLKIKNHSAAFWLEVGRLMPDYRLHKEWLRRNGHSLTLTGNE